MTFKRFPSKTVRQLADCSLPLQIGFIVLVGTASMGRSQAPPIAVVGQSIPVHVAQTPLGAAVLYVNPAAGVDAPGGGSQSSPLRTITYALQQATPGTVVQLDRGSYTQQTGEVFPIYIPAGVSLRGEEATNGQTVAIIGGGEFVSPTFARQNATFIAGKDGEIRGIAVTNPNVRGTGIWVESTNPKIENCTFARNHREGIFITGAGNPSIEKNIFSQNGGNGISAASNARGDIHANVFQNTGFGLAIGGNSAPVVRGNRIIDNTDGVYINDAARPVLRGNTIENNKRDGIVVTTNAVPDLGSESDAGNNTIQGNRQYDLNNNTKGTLYSVGNRLNSQRVKGAVEFSGSLVATGNSNFRDVQGHWAQPYIEALAKQNIITGFPDGTFRPSDQVTRVQFAAIAAKAFSPPAREPRAEFGDVSSSFWGYQAIQTAAQGGFMKGYPGGLFKPNERIPRVQALVSLATGLGYGAGNPTVLSRFQDVTQIPDWATAAIAAATQRQIVVNYPTLAMLMPNREATRAEVAAFVYQALVNAGRAEAIASPYIVSTQ